MLNDNYHSSVFVGRRLCKLIVFSGLVIEVSITVVGPSGALWEWIYRCSLIRLMTSGRGARAYDAVAEQGCAGNASGGATLELQSRGIRTVGLTVRHEVPYGTFLTASEQSRSPCVFGSRRYWVRADETGSLG